MVSYNDFTALRLSKNQLELIFGSSRQSVIANNEDEPAGAKSRAVAAAVSSVLSSHRFVTPKTTSTNLVPDADRMSN